MAEHAHHKMLAFHATDFVVVKDPPQKNRALKLRQSQNRSSDPRYHQATAVSSEVNQFPK
jgi:hypothetical protein